MAYATAALVKSYLGIISSADDPLLTALCTRAQAAIDRYCNRTFEASADSTRYFDAFGPHVYGPTLFVDRDLCAITSVTNGDGESLTSTHYVTIPRNDTPYHGLKLKTVSGRTWTYTTDWERAVTIVGKWAYSTAAPDDVVQAAVRLAAFYYRQKDAPLQDVTAIEAGVVIKPLAIPADVIALLKPLRRV
jgi:hypothetical protein